MQELVQQHVAALVAEESARLLQPTQLREIAARMRAYDTAEESPGD